MPLFLFAMPVLSTLLGGLLALRLRRYLSLLLAVGAGLLLGAAFLDLLPEAIALAGSAGRSPTDVLGLTLLSFLLFHGAQDVMERVSSRLRAGLTQRVSARHVGAAMLVFHSFRDGMAIGATYTVAPAAALAVALGIAAHDVGDGMNTVILTTHGEPAGPGDYAFLAADAIAPFLGGILTLHWVLSSWQSVVLLTLAAGFFLEMATGEFLPSVRRSAGPMLSRMPPVLFGAALIYVANLLLSRR